MVVCYVGNFNTLSVGEPEIAASLEELGHEVIKLDEWSTDAVQIKQVIEKEKCDLLLFAKFRIKNTREEIKRFLETLEIPTVMWVFDLYFNIEE